MDKNDSVETNDKLPEKTNNDPPEKPEDNRHDLSGIAAKVAVFIPSAALLAVGAYLASFRIGSSLLRTPSFVGGLSRYSGRVILLGIAAGIAAFIVDRRKKQPSAAAPADKTETDGIEPKAVDAEADTTALVDARSDAEKNEG